MLPTSSMLRTVAAGIASIASRGAACWHQSLTRVVPRDHPAVFTPARPTTTLHSKAGTFGAEMERLEEAVPHEIRVAASPHERHYFYVVDDNGRLYLEATPRRNIATCLRDAQFLRFFYERIVSSATWWQARMRAAAKAAARSPVSGGGEQVSEKIADSAVAASPAAVAASAAAVLGTPSLRELSPAMASFLGKYPYVSLCGVELNWIHAYTSPVVYVAVETPGAASPASSASSPPSPTSSLLWAGGTLRVPFEPSRLQRRGDGKVLHPAPPADAFVWPKSIREAAGIVPAAVCEEQRVREGAGEPRRASKGGRGGDAAMVGLVSHALVEQLTRGDFSTRRAARGPEGAPGAGDGEGEAEDLEKEAGGAARFVFGEAEYVIREEGEDAG